MKKMTEESKRVRAIGRTDERSAVGWWLRGLANDCGDVGQKVLLLDLALRVNAGEHRKRKRSVAVSGPGRKASE